MSNSSAILSLLKMQCPRCHEGPMFNGEMLNPKNFDAMYSHCPNCGLRYERELGFYWGAMYLSYGLSVGVIFFVSLGIYYLAGDPDTWVYMTGVVVSIVLLTPFLYRYSRVLMLHLFGSVSYDPKARGN
jgi:uncharacterized protein (DUF983 family)